MRTCASNPEAGCRQWRCYSSGLALRRAKRKVCLIVFSVKVCLIAEVVKVAQILVKVDRIIVKVNEHAGHTSCCLWGISSPKLMI